MSFNTGPTTSDLCGSAGAEVTAMGVLGDLIKVLQRLN
jgi:homoserine dehydrogenase